MQKAVPAITETQDFRFHPPSTVFTLAVMLSPGLTLCSRGLFYAGMYVWSVSWHLSQYCKASAEMLLNAASLCSIHPSFSIQDPASTSKGPECGYSWRTLMKIWHSCCVETMTRAYDPLLPLLWTVTGKSDLSVVVCRCQYMRERRWVTHPPSNWQLVCSSWKTVLVKGKQVNNCSIPKSLLLLQVCIETIPDWH